MFRASLSFEHVSAEFLALPVGPGTLVMHPANPGVAVPCCQPLRIHYGHDMAHVLSLEIANVQRERDTVVSVHPNAIVEITCVAAGRPGWVGIERILVTLGHGTHVGALEHGTIVYSINGGPAQTCYNNDAVSLPPQFRRLVYCAAERPFDPVVPSLNTTRQAAYVFGDAAEAFVPIMLSADTNSTADHTYAVRLGYPIHTTIACGSAARHMEATVRCDTPDALKMDLVRDGRSVAAGQLSSESLALLRAKLRAAPMLSHVVVAVVSAQGPSKSRSLHWELVARLAADGNGICLGPALFHCPDAPVVKVQALPPRDKVETHFVYSNADDRIHVQLALAGTVCSPLVVLHPDHVAHWIERGLPLAVFASGTERIAIGATHTGKTIQCVAMPSVPVPRVQGPSISSHAAIHAPASDPVACPVKVHPGALHNSEFPIQRHSTTRAICSVHEWPGAPHLHADTSAGVRLVIEAGASRTVLDLPADAQGMSTAGELLTVARMEVRVPLPETAGCCLRLAFHMRTHDGANLWLLTQNEDDPMGRWQAMNIERHTATAYLVATGTDHVARLRVQNGMLTSVAVFRVTAETTVRDYVAAVAIEGCATSWAPGVAKAMRDREPLNLAWMQHVDETLVMHRSANGALLLPRSTDPSEVARRLGDEIVVANHGTPRPVSSCQCTDTHIRLMGIEFETLHV